MDERLIREFLLPKQLEIYNEMLRKKVQRKYEFQCIGEGICSKCGGELVIEGSVRTRPEVYICKECRNRVVMGG